MKEEMLQKALMDLGWQELLTYLSARCVTEKGCALALQVMPFQHLGDAQKRSHEISEARALWIEDKALSFGGISDVQPLLEKAQRGERLEPYEFLSIARTLRQGISIKNHIHTYQDQVPLLCEHANTLWEGKELAFQIENTFTETGEIKDSASAELRSLRRKLQSTQSEAQRRANALLEQESFRTALQDRYVTQRDGRYVLPIRTEARMAVRGMIQDRSGSGGTVFIEPDSLIECNNQLKLTALELLAEEERILQKLAQFVFSVQIEILQNVAILAHLDFIQAGARLAVDLQANPLHIETNPQAHIRLYKARHPLLVLKGVQVIPNDILLQKGSTLVLSGPNAGGKTVSMKLLGLFSLMSRAGLFCPAQEGSTIPWFSSVFTDIGDEQSLERNLSTFSGHIQNICYFLAHASSDTLFLLDEVAAGTDPEQGAALAQAVLESLAEQKSTVLVTTHYPSLKQLAFSDFRFINASVGYDVDKLQPTYRLHLLVPGPSETLPVAKRLGVQENVIERTKQLLRKEKLEAEAMLHQLMEQREELTIAKQKAEEAEKQAIEKNKKLENLLLQTQAELQKHRRKAHDEVVYALQQARRELEETKQSLRQKNASGAVTTEALTIAKKRLDSISGQVFAMTQDNELPKGNIPVSSDLVKGTEVYVRKLSSSAKVLSVPVKDKVWIQAGTIKLQVLLSELNLLHEKDKQSNLIEQGRVTSKKSQPSTNRFSHEFSQIDSSTNTTIAIRTPGNTIDVRGERVDDALLRAETFVNQAIHQNESAVFIIHGHGTGALKQAIRAHFSSYPQIKDVVPGAPEDGGDGVTILYFD